MNDHAHIAPLLQDYIDDALTPAEREVVDAHLQTCQVCRAEHAALTAVMTAVDALPRSIEPPHDLWPEIAARLDAPRRVEAAAKPTLPANGRADRSPVHLRSRRGRIRLPHALAIGLALVTVVGALWLLPRLFTPAWDVARLEGAPRVGDTPLAGTGQLQRGEWLVTDDQSRAVLNVGAIGNVEVEPNTRLQLVAASLRNHRLSLASGTIEARIAAPPRLFFVETPSALAIDLGCAYRLHVDSTGGSILHVTAGYVELQHGDRTAVVPAGSMCLTRPGHGPGTPFDEDASDAFRRALAWLDFDDGGAEALTALLAEARPLDAPTLWQLMYTIDPAERGRLYDRLVDLVSAPAGIPRDAVLRADLAAIEAWDRHLNMDLDTGWFFRLFNKKKTRSAAE